MIYEITDAINAAPLFGDWEETLIWSCLQGIMGKIYANDLNRPTAAMAMIADFIFFAGKPNQELVLYKPDRCTKDFMIMVPQNEQWENMIMHCYQERAKKSVRYAIKKEPDVFDKDKLEKAVASLPEQYNIAMIDESLYHMCRAEAWSSDFVSQFPDYEKYRKLGVGAVVCKDNIIVSGASSYTRYRDGIEIEIDTRKEYRQKGLAYACGAKLILECLKRDLYPSWDAQNKISVVLAEKLGYHFSHEYTAVEIYGYAALHG